MIVYLAGPINGMSDADAKDWREHAKKQLHPFDTLDPMRRDYRGVELSNVAVIVEPDKTDIALCDVILAMCPKPSVGTSMEVFYSWLIGKPVYVVAPSPASPWLVYHSRGVFATLDEAISAIKGTGFRFGPHNSDPHEDPEGRH